MINPKARPCDEATIKLISAVGNRSAREKQWVLVATILASSISYIDEFVVNIALPAIETDLGASVVVTMACQCIPHFAFPHLSWSEVPRVIFSAADVCS